MVGLTKRRAAGPRGPLLVAGLAALAAVAASGLVITASVTGWPSWLFPFTPPSPQTLPEGADIAGWAAFDRDSYLIGEPIRYRVRILYRGDRIAPRLESFSRSLPVFPLDRRSVRETTRARSGNVVDYRLEAILHAIYVEPQPTYAFAPAVVFYRAVSEPGGRLRSLRIPTPSIHIAAYYPRDVSAVALRPPKPALRDRASLRRGLVAAGGAVLLTTAVFLLWWFGHRRRAEALSETERLWREYHALEGAGLGGREHLLRCERIFTRLLQIHAGTDPRAFWAGDFPDDAFWRPAARRAQKALQRLYGPGDIGEPDVRRILSLLDLDGIFATLLAEERLKREEQPSFLRRLASQPRILALAGTLGAAALVLFVLAARPGLWLSPDVARYNAAVAALGRGVPLVEDGVRMAELAGRVAHNGIKAAALYNAGTAFAHMRESADSPLREREVFEALFNEKASLAAYLDTPEEVDQFLKGEKWLRRAERVLKDAVRANPGDEDARRNLELVIKRHRAVLGAIRALFAASQGRPAQRGIKGVKLKASQRKAIVDVLNMKWPDRLKDDKGEGKKDTGYGVSEHY